MHSEMGPVRQNRIQRTVRTAHLSVLMTVHSFSTQYNQNSSDNLHSYFQTNIIAQVLSVGGKGVCAWKLQLESGSDVVIEVMTWLEACLEAAFLHSLPYITLKPPLGSPRSHKY